MKLILDTNVFVSGVFFSGPPYLILNAWRQARIMLVVSIEILDEYRRVGEDLAITYPEVDLAPPLELMTIAAEVVSAPPLNENVCSDPNDDKFIACALASGVKIICSGDKALIKASGYRDIKIISPRRFMEEYLNKKN